MTDSIWVRDKKMKDVRTICYYLIDTGASKKTKNGRKYEGNKPSDLDPSIQYFPKHLKPAEASFKISVEVGDTEDHRPPNPYNQRWTILGKSAGRIYC